MFLFALLEDPSLDQSIRSCQDASGKLLLMSLAWRFVLPENNTFVDNIDQN